MQRRRKSRILALLMLYALEVQKTTSMGVARSTLNIFTRRAEQCVEDFALSLVRGVLAHQAEIDQLIVARSDNWRIERIAAVDRLMMRIALYEMLFEPQTPAAVCINEAIEIAKQFSTAESGHFVNGVLDSIRKTRASSPA